MTDQQLLELLEEVDANVWELDAQTLALTYVSKSILGMPEREGIGVPGYWASRIHPEDRERVLALTAKAIDDCSDHETEYRLATAAGGYVWVHDTVKVVVGEDGRAQSLRGLSLDITQRKVAEEAREKALEDLHQDRERLRILSAGSEVLSSTLDRQETLQNLARAAVPGFADYCLVAIVGREDGTEVSYAHRDPAREELLETLTRQPLRSRQSLALRAIEECKTQLVAEIPEEMLQSAAQDDEQRMALTALGPRSSLFVPLLDKDTAFGVIGFAYAESGRHYCEEDISLAEELGRRASLAVQRSNLLKQAQDALAVRNQFLSMASHELKTPLTSIKGYSYVMLRDARGRDDKQAIEMLEVIDEEADRMARLINELLDVSRIEHGRLRLSKEEFSLNELVYDAMARARLAAREYSFELDERVSDLPVYADRMRIEQVATNLLNNAVKYSTESRRIDVVLQKRPGQAIVEITDHGIGIPENEQGRVFEQFFQSSKPRIHRGGLGLGLFIAKTIVSEHGGEIGFKSSEGAGSTFYFSLPLAVS
jgi:PAS domain S-box-containing protein